MEINGNKRETVLYLAKPSKEIVSPLWSILEDSLNFTVTVGEVGEISFDLPYFVEDDFGNKIKNEVVDLVKEKMLILLNFNGENKWFVIDSIKDEIDGMDTLSVDGFGLGYEISSTIIQTIDGEARKLESLVLEILDTTPWTLGEIDDELKILTRSVDISEETTRLEALTNAVEMFGGRIEFDDDKRKVNIVNPERQGYFRGLRVTQDRLLQGIKRSTDTTEMATRLYAYGSEGLSIRAENPTGLPYIDDFSYFMYPFEMKDGKVIKKSHMMSDELCISLTKQKQLTEENAPKIKKLVNDILTAEIKKTEASIEMYSLKGDLTAIQHRLDTAKAVGNDELVSEIKIEEKAKEAQIKKKDDELNGYIDEISLKNAELSTLRKSIEKGAGFTQDTLYELKMFTIEKVWTNDAYTSESELYEDAHKFFEELRTPKISVEIDIDNLFDIAEEQILHDRLMLNEIIEVEYDRLGIIYRSNIHSISYSDSNIKVLITNTKSISSNQEIFNNLISDMKNATSVVDKNKYQFNKITGLESDLAKFIEGEIDANKQQINAGANNSIEIGNRGIIVTNPDRKNEMIIIQSGIMALSKDAGETWSTAVKPDGIVADRLIGKLIMSHKMIIEDANGVIVINGSLQEVFDKQGNSKVRIGEYEKGKYGISISDGALVIENGIKKDMLGDDVNKEFKDINNTIDRNKGDIENKLNSTANSLSSEITAKINNFNDNFLKPNINQVQTDMSKLKKEQDEKRAKLQAQVDAGEITVSQMDARISKDLRDNKNAILKETQDRINATKEIIANAEKMVDTVRADLHLTGSLPTSIKMDSSGITAYNNGSTTKFARMDYRGLYVQGGALDIRTVAGDSRGVQIDGDGITGYDSRGRVGYHLKNDGTLIAHNGIFTGVIHATSGSFSGDITGSRISGVEIVGSKISSSTLSATFDDGEFSIGENTSAFYFKKGNSRTYSELKIDEDNLQLESKSGSSSASMSINSNGIEMMGTYPSSRRATYRGAGIEAHDAFDISASGNFKIETQMHHDITLGASEGTVVLSSESGKVRIGGAEVRIGRSGKSTVFLGTANFSNATVEGIKAENAKYADEARTLRGYKPSDFAQSDLGEVRFMSASETRLRIRVGKYEKIIDWHA